MAREQQEHGDLRDLVASGMTDKQIAALYSVSERTILRWRHQDGIPTEPKQSKVGHGTPTRYVYGCRCDSCTRANRERHTETRKNLKQRGLPSDDPRHGLATTYANWGCRCERCNAAQSEKNRLYRLERYGPPKHRQFDAADDEIVRSFPPPQAAEMLGRTMSSVYQRRSKIGASRSQKDPST